jgi:hypothetical protein
MNTAEFKAHVLAELAWRFPHARIEFEEKLGFGTSTPAMRPKRISNVMSLVWKQ